MSRKPRTYDEFFRQEGKELFRMLQDRFREGHLYKRGEPKIEDYALPEFGYLLREDELLKVMVYIHWSIKAKKKGAPQLLESEKVRRARADYEEFESKKAEFENAKVKAPRKKAIEFFMKKWNANNESTVEKRIAKWGKTPEGAVLVTFAKMERRRMQKKPEGEPRNKLKAESDDEIPF